MAGEAEDEALKVYLSDTQRCSRCDYLLVLHEGHSAGALLGARAIAGHASASCLAFLPCHAASYDPPSRSLVNAL